MSIATALAGVTIPTSAYSDSSSISQLSYNSLLDSAENLTKGAKWAEAADIYKELLKRNPGSPLNSKLFANLGLCQTHTGDYDDAIQSYDIALVKEPNSARIMSNKASLLLLMGQNEAANKLLQQALLIDSLAPEALRLHGQLMLMDNRAIEAERDFSHLMKSDSLDAWGPAGRAEALIAQNKLTDAIPLLMQALTLQEASEFRISLIESQLRSNKLADAENSIREAVTRYPQTGEFYLLRAMLNRILHQNRQADADKKTAIEYGVDPQIIEKYLPTYEK